MSKWRRLAIAAISNSIRPHMGRELRFIRSIEFAPPDQKDAAVGERLERILLHAAATVPYYSRVLVEAGVVEGGRVRIENFANIPFLTKDIIRREGEGLYSRGHEARHSYKTSSGGCTGEPVTFLEDRECWGRHRTTRFVFNEWVGPKPGDREMMLWGALREILPLEESTSERLKNRFFNARMLNAYRMGPEQMTRYVAEWNRFRPVLVWAFTRSIYEFARFIRANGLRVVAPRAITVTSESLTEEMRTFVEQVIGCPVINQYGSREVGPVACECSEKNGLHILENGVKVEVVGADGQVVGPGEQGEVVATGLANKSMPIIRYKVGDTAVPSDRTCACGRPFAMLESVTGRTLNHFHRRDGVLVNALYFIRLFWHRPWVKRFQLRQKSHDLVVAYLVKVSEPPPGEIEEVQAKTRAAMGEGCELRFEFVDDIPPSPSGKYLYTICELPRDGTNHAPA